jgi:hypothetical protein
MAEWFKALDLGSKSGVESLVRKGVSSNLTAVKVYVVFLQERNERTNERFFLFFAFLEDGDDMMAVRLLLDSTRTTPLSTPPRFRIPVISFQLPNDKTWALLDHLRQLESTSSSRFLRPRCC